MWCSTVRLYWYHGESLNDHLLQGPDLTSKLTGVLTRFREERVAFMADIEKMFYRAKVKKADQDFLRFLWWPNGILTKEPGFGVDLSHFQNTPEFVNLNL